MRYLFVAVLGVAGAALSAWLSDLCITSVERDQSLFTAVSCLSCARARELWDRIPLLSWLLNGGRCRFCGAVLSKREPIVSACTLALWMLGLRVWMPWGTGYTLISVVSGSALICAAGICWSGKSEKPILLPLLVCMGGLSLLLPDGLGIVDRLIGLCGMLSFGIILYLLPGRLIGQEKLRKDTVLYLGCIGLVIGWRSCFVILPAAVIVGAVSGLITRKRKKRISQGKDPEARQADPAGGRFSLSLWITCSAVITLLAGRTLMNWYLGLFAGIK